MARAPIARRRANARLLALALLSAVSLMYGSSAAQAASITLEVSPGRGLVPGQWVAVSWTGVPEGSPVAFRQCTDDPGTIRDCSYLGANALRTGGIASASGSGWMTFPVAGVVNGRETSDRFSCDHDDPCSIALFTDPSATDIDTAVLEPIRFTVDIRTCSAPSESDVVVSGSGTFTLARAFDGWAGRLCRSPRDTYIRYRVTSSLAAEDAFVDDESMFAITSQPLASESIEALRDDDRTFAYAPLVGSGLAFGYRMTDPTTGEPITELRLTPEQLARIFTGQLRDLGADPDIVAQNAGVTFPPAIQVVGRADPSAQTQLLTTWFLEVARREYRAGGDAFGDRPTDTYPRTGSITLVSGARSVAGTVADPAAANRSSFGTIGWMDSSVAELYALPTVLVENGAGEFVAPTLDSLAAAIRAMKVDPNGVTTTPRFRAGGPKAYALPVVTYAVMQTNATADYDDTEADVLRAFVRLVASDVDRARTTRGSLPPGYAPLPASMTADARRAAERLPTTAYAAPSTGTPSPGTGSTSGSGSGSGYGGGSGGFTFPDGSDGGGGGAGSPTPPNSGGGTTSPTPSASPSPSLPPGPDVLPPTALTASSGEYAWPVVLIGAIALIVLGTVMSFALTLASRYGAKKAVSEDGTSPEPPDPTSGR